MGLNTGAVKQQSTKARVQQTELAVDSYMARIAQIIDLGLQPRELWDTVSNKYVVDTEKRPQNKVMVTYEFLTEFCVDAAGVPDETKPRWLSEEIFLLPLFSDLATSTKRSKAIDPQGKLAGNWEEYCTLPCTVTIAHKASGKAKIGMVTPAMKGIPYPELKNQPKLFLLDSPDLEVFGSLPDWVKDKIKSNLEYNGSALDKLLGGEGAPAPVQPQPKPAPAPIVEPVPEEDMPW